MNSELARTSCWVGGHINAPKASRGNHHIGSSDKELVELEV
jgi:hypothetical protein